MAKKTAKPRVKAGTSKSAAAERRIAFANAYIANGRNGTQAAITAGYSPNGAEVAASRLLKDVKTRELIDTMTADHGQATGLTVERVLKEVERLAFSDVRRFLGDNGAMKPICDLDDDSAAALASVEFDDETGLATKFKVWDKNTALEKAMKHLGLYERDNAQRSESLALQVVLVK